jgi:predicted ATPase
MDLSHSNEARRFITLIDELYQHGVKLICSAEVDAELLFPRTVERKPNTIGAIAGEEEVFAFNRTVSRLSEMQTKQYLEKKHHKE